jgi:hypothetical protein
MRRFIMQIGVIVRWSDRRQPPANGTGYDLWDGEAWLPITAAEFNGYKARGLSIHVNPRWANRG